MPDNVADSIQARLLKDAAWLRLLVKKIEMPDARGTLRLLAIAADIEIACNGIKNGLFGDADVGN